MRSGRRQNRSGNSRQHLASVFCSPGPWDPPSCICPNTPNSDEWVVIGLQQSLMTSRSFEWCKSVTIVFGYAVNRTHTRENGGCSCIWCVADRARRAQYVWRGWDLVMETEAMCRIRSGSLHWNLFRVRNVLICLLWGTLLHIRYNIHLDRSFSNLVIFFLFVCLFSFLYFPCLLLFLRTQLTVHITNLRNLKLALTHPTFVSPVQWWF